MGTVRSAEKVRGGAWEGGRVRGADTPHRYLGEPRGRHRAPWKLEGSCPWT